MELGTIKPTDITSQPMLVSHNRVSGVNLSDGFNNLEELEILPFGDICGIVTIKGVNAEIEGLLTDKFTNKEIPINMNINMKATQIEPTKANVEEILRGKIGENDIDAKFEGKAELEAVFPLKVFVEGNWNIKYATTDQFKQELNVKTKSSMESIGLAVEVDQESEVSSGQEKLANKKFTMREALEDILNLKGKIDVSIYAQNPTAAEELKVEGTSDWNNLTQDQGAQYSGTLNNQPYKFTIKQLDEKGKKLMIIKETPGYKVVYNVTLHEN